ncbi:hypothetical protein F4778DRAFT_786752 [Xylariomycetidae sp. FL2044]|nr:hypothetical protein F4778DRAFT_786752 [Xylariomycetidae sp. FL2044]
MVTTTTSSPRPVDESQYYYLPADQDSQDAEMQGFGWTEPIVIDDEDLMFGGKSLSAWYEEERKSVSYPAEEERRGRQRIVDESNRCANNTPFRITITTTTIITIIPTLATSTTTIIIIITTMMEPRRARRAITNIRIIRRFRLV